MFWIFFFFKFTIFFIFSYLYTLCLDINRVNITHFTFKQCKIVIVNRYLWQLETLNHSAVYNSTYFCNRCVTLRSFYCLLSHWTLEEHCWNAQQLHVSKIWKFHYEINRFLKLQFICCHHIIILICGWNDVMRQAGT